MPHAEKNGEMLYAILAVKSDALLYKMNPTGDVMDIGWSPFDNEYPEVRQKIERQQAGI